MVELAEEQAALSDVEVAHPTEEACPMCEGNNVADVRICRIGQHTTESVTFEALQKLVGEKGNGFEIWAAMYLPFLNC